MDFSEVHWHAAYVFEVLVLKPRNAMNLAHNIHLPVTY